MPPIHSIFNNVVSQLVSDMRKLWSDLSPNKTSNGACQQFENYPGRTKEAVRLKDQEDKRSS